MNESANDLILRLGPVGKQICQMAKDPQTHLKPFVKFKRVDGDIPELPEQIRATLLRNNDQKMFYKLAIGIQRGHLPEHLTYDQCGKLNLARYVRCPICVIVATPKE